MLIHAETLHGVIVVIESIEDMSEASTASRQALRVTQGDGFLWLRVPAPLEKPEPAKNICYSAGTVVSGRVIHVCDAVGAKPSTSAVVAKYPTRVPMKINGASSAMICSSS